MLILFIIGLLVTGYSIYILYHLWTRLEEFDVVTIRDWFWILFISLLLVTVGPTMVYYGYTEPGSQIHHIVDNGNGTLTVTEYSISGDSTVVTNVKGPKDTYGVVTNVSNKTEMYGKVVHNYTVVTCKLNDGRTVTHRFNEVRRDITVGKGMKMREKFYPAYNQTFYF